MKVPIQTLPTPGDRPGQCPPRGPITEAIADEVQQLIIDGTPPREIAVLLRCFATKFGKSYASLKTALQVRDVPFFLVKDDAALTSAAALDLLAYAKVIKDTSA